MPKRTRLQNGSINDVWREGDTVIRSAGPWTPAVHALLTHLERNGFQGAPRVVGVEDAHEVLTYLEGIVPTYPASPDYWSDDSLVTIAQMMRGLHDITAGFEHPGPWRTDGAPAGGGDVICHNDITMYNTVFRNRRPAALIDWDYAAPAPRVWDVAYSAYRFVPLMPDSELARLGISGPVDRSARLKLFCDAYGLDRPGRSQLIDTLLQRLDSIIELFKTGAEKGDANFVRMVDEGQLDEYRRDIDFITAVRPTLEAQLLRDTPSTEIN